MLDVEIGGTGDPFLTITANNAGNLTGQYTFSDRPAISFTNVETLSTAADLAITNSDGQSEALAGSPITYSVVASNNGPVGMNGVRVTDTLPAAITGVTWTCTASPGSSCGSPNGSGDILDTVSVAVGGSVIYQVSGTVDPSASGALIATATVSPPSGVTDPVPANDSAPDTDTVTRALLPGRAVTIKPGKATFVAKAAKGDSFPLPSVDPVTVGGSLQLFDVATTAGDNTYELPTGATAPLGWKALGNPPGSKGYKYKGAGAPGDPCKAVVVNEKVIKASCVGSDVTLTPPFAGAVGVIFRLGTADRYCAQFGGEEVRNDAKLTKRKNAPALGACP